MSAIGPQSPNFSTARPPTDAEVSPLDTWFRDCSAAGSNDGTVVSASWLNVVTAQLRTAVRNAGIALDDGDDEMLWKAIQFAADQANNNLTASRGLNRVGDDWQMDVGLASNGVIPFGNVQPTVDMLPVYDNSGNVVSETSIYSAVKAVLRNVTGAIFNDAIGAIEFSADRQTSQVNPPAGVVFGDTWYETDTDILYMWTTDGLTSFWLQIS